MSKILIFCICWITAATSTGRPSPASIGTVRLAALKRADRDFIKRFPALAKVLTTAHPWELAPARLASVIFKDKAGLAQGSAAYPLLYVKKRSDSYKGEQVWDDVAYETEYYVFDPARPLVRFHIGRPLDVRLQTLDHKNVEAIRPLFPVLPDSARQRVASNVKRLMRILAAYGAAETDFKHPRIHQYLLPGGTKLTLSDFSGTGVGSVYMQIDLEPMRPVAKLVNKFIPAFPGAEGYGAYTPGGRGGKVYLVTTLQDYLSHPREGRKAGTLGEHEDGQSAPLLPAYPSLPAEKVIHGSLREAIEAKGPRTILFAISGTIQLKDQLKINDPYVTLAGNTAPGQGVQLCNWGIEVHTHDVVLRYLKVRVGDNKGPDETPRVLGDQTHAIDISGANVVVDHCEFAYANDQLVNIYAYEPGERAAITFQWNYVYGGLANSTHEKGAHSMSYFLNGWGFASFHHNLTAHSLRRNPRVWGLWLDYRNNLLYDYADSGYGEEPADYVKLNLVGNTQIRGQQTYAFQGLGQCGQYFAADNDLPPGFRPPLMVPKETIMPQPFNAPFPRTQSSVDAVRLILKQGGSLLPGRDSISNFVRESVLKRTGKVPNSPADWPLGGFPDIAKKFAPVDSDKDGMPDYWEKLYRLNPHDPADANQDTDADGYTNLEEFINGTSPRYYINYHKTNNNVDQRFEAH